LGRAVNIILEEEFSDQELELIREMAEYALDRDSYAREDDEEKLETLISILKKTGSDLIRSDEDDEEEEEEPWWTE
jgi:hypothetical protein